MIVTHSPLSRRVAGVISIAAFVAIGVQTVINEGNNPLVNLALMLRYFTIWSNMAAALLLGWVALRGRLDARIAFALATALAMVGIVYHLLLSADHHPVGWDWYTNQMHHTVIPLATVFWWLAFSGVKATGWQTLPVVIAVPILYTGFALVVGSTSGFYPYFFLDLPTLGWGQLLINVVGLGLVFMAFGALLMGMRKLITARA